MRMEMVGCVARIVNVFVMGAFMYVLMTQYTYMCGLHFHMHRYVYIRIRIYIDTYIYVYTRIYAYGNGGLCLMCRHCIFDWGVYVYIRN